MQLHNSSSRRKRQGSKTNQDPAVPGLPALPAQLLCSAAVRAQLRWPDDSVVAPRPPLQGEWVFALLTALQRPALGMGCGQMWSYFTLTRLAANCFSVSAISNVRIGTDS